MIMLLKKGARKPLALLSKSGGTGYYPNGVGWIEGSNPVYSIELGSYRLYVTEEYVDTLVEELLRTKKGAYQ